MNTMLTIKRSKFFIVVLLSLQASVYVTVFFRIPVARQILGFVYFTFFPGMIFIKLFKLDKNSRLENLLFSIGFSIAFLVIAGFLINEFGFVFNISKPLSLLPLMVTLNGLILLGGALACLRSDGTRPQETKIFGLHPSMLLFVGLLVLSVAGALCAGVFQNSMISLFLLISISLLFVVGIISRKVLPSRLYPLAVIAIAISLLFNSSLVSNYLVSFGSDVPVEYYCFETARKNAYWNSTGLPFSNLDFNRINAMLSVTVLPTIYSSLLNIDSKWIFKIIYPLIFSLVPLGLYTLWRKYVSSKYAFISAFLFMAIETFYTEMLGLTRQIIAELFFVSLLLVISNENMKLPGKMICFAILSFGLVTSHYGLSLIFLLFISLTLVSSLVVRRLNRNITLSMVVLFFALMFIWYIYTSNSAVFDSILEFGNYVYDQLGEFFNPESRGETVMRGLGLETPQTIWNAISRAYAYITEFLIGLGFLGLILKRVKAHYEGEHFTFSLVAMGLLLALVLVPGLAETLNMNRFYHILLVFLAPLCALGAEFIARLASKPRKQVITSILLLAILTPYFLFQTSFVYEITGSESWSLPLSMHRMTGLKLYRGMGYIPKQNVFGAYWLSKYADTLHTKVYADIDSQHKALLAYGLMHHDSITLLSNTTTIETNGIIYLGRLNVVDGNITSRYFVWNSSELSYLFSDATKTYSSGGCEIYKNVMLQP